jgi:hypothetical protein
VAQTATLQELVLGLRAEAMQSLNTLHGVNADPTYREILARVQRQLWLDFAWPHLRVDRDRAMAAGQRYYDFPTDMALERVESVSAKWSGVWHALERGIGIDEMNAQDSDADIRADPVIRWAPRENNQWEAWPMPASNNGVVRFTGIKNLRALVNPGDSCDLDRDLIVIFAAVEIAAEQKSPRVQALASRAQQHYAKLRQGGEHNSDRRFRLGGGGGAGNGFGRRMRPPLVAVDRGN